MSDAQELIRQGRPRAALAALQMEVRSNPGEVRLRIFLFQLLCLLGQWQRALGQLQVCSELDDSTLAMVATYRDALQCELLREAVFSGRTTPMVFGPPTEWVAQLIQALRWQAEGRGSAAAALRAQALESAAAGAGRIDGRPFSWLADADSRIGPVLEAVMNGRYFWIPLQNLSRVVIEPPSDLRDLVWAPAHLEFAQGGESVALIPTRYVQTAELAAEDDALLMARRTDWLPLQPVQHCAAGATDPAGRAGVADPCDSSGDADQFAGLGQRLLITDEGEFGLLEVREILFNPPVHEAAPDHTVPSPDA